MTPVFYGFNRSTIDRLQALKLCNTLDTFFLFIPCNCYMLLTISIIQQICHQFVLQCIQKYPKCACYNAIIHPQTSFSTKLSVSHSGICHCTIVTGKSSGTNYQSLLKASTKVYMYKFSLQQCKYKLFAIKFSETTSICVNTFGFIYIF